MTDDTKEYASRLRVRFSIEPERGFLYGEHPALELDDDEVIFWFGNTVDGQYIKLGMAFEDFGRAVLKSLPLWAQKLINRIQGKAQ